LKSTRKKLQRQQNGLIPLQSQGAVYNQVMMYHICYQFHITQCKKFANKQCTKMFLKIAYFYLLTH